MGVDALIERAAELRNHRARSSVLSSEECGVITILSAVS
jgi:hypothetical protein